MSKIAIAVLTIAAFLFAAWLVLFRRELPDPKGTGGLQRRFILATLLFVGLLSVNCLASHTPDNNVLCYMVAPPETTSNITIAHYEVVTTLKAVWRTLDPGRSEEFRNKLQAAVSQSVIRRKTADMLAIAYSELAFHKWQTRGKGKMMTCYKMTQLGSTLAETRENTLKQIELLEGAKKSGKIDEETAIKAQTVLAREIEMLYRAKDLELHKNRTEQERLIEEYKAGEIDPGDSASVAAGMIVEMEDGKAAEATTMLRLIVMEKRVESLFIGGGGGFRGGPAGNDWMDPDISPNVITILEEAGIVYSRPMVMFCYERNAMPIKERSEELKKLQEELLDKNVEMGVLDVEVAEKAAQASAMEQKIEYATEKDIMDYQKDVRRTVRLLYKHGELPASFVKQVEQAADVEIIAFNPAKALRDDIRWYLRSLLDKPVDSEVLKILETRNLIPLARNHRLIMKWLGGKRPEIPDDVKRKLAEFEMLLDGEYEFNLAADKNIVIKDWEKPQTDNEYKLKIRRTCRALVKTGLAAPEKFKQIEYLIEMPVVGVLGGN